MRQAEWNNITWGVKGNQMAYLKTFKISQGIKIEEQENETGGNKTVVKSLEPEVINVSYGTGFAVGIDPRGEFEMLKKCAGMQDTFVLGGKKVSKQNFMLDEISLSNTTLNNDGQILTGDIALTFTTNATTSSKGGKNTGSTTSTKTKAKKTGSLKLTAQDYANARALVN